MNKTKIHSLVDAGAILIIVVLVVGAFALAAGASVKAVAKPTYAVACISTKGVLSNQSKGKCPRGTVRVSIPLTTIQGATGPVGPQGASGSNGLNGSVGPTGAQGVQGSQGIQGAAGHDGTNGTNGVSGYTASVQTLYSNVSAGTYQAFCASGYSVVTGGYSQFSGTNALVTGSWPVNASAWSVSVTGTHINVVVSIVCEIAN